VDEKHETAVWDGPFSYPFSYKNFGAICIGFILGLFVSWPFLDKPPGEPGHSPSQERLEHGKKMLANAAVSDIIQLEDGSLGLVILVDKKDAYLAFKRPTATRPNPERVSFALENCDPILAKMSRRYSPGRDGQDYLNLASRWVREYAHTIAGIEMPSTAPGLHTTATH